LESMTRSDDLRREGTPRRRGGRKFINEATMFKVLVERDGILFSVTLKRRAYYFFLSRLSVGIRVAPTTDPFPGIVELSDYEISKILRNWGRLSNALVRSGRPEKRRS
jgi:hypothetical protein